MKKRYFVIAVALFLVGYFILLKGTEESVVVSNIQEEINSMDIEKDSMIKLANDIKDEVRKNKDDMEILDGTLKDKDIILIERNKDIQNYIKELKNLLLESEELRKQSDSARIDSEKMRLISKKLQEEAEKEKMDHLKDNKEYLKKYKELENKYELLLEELKSIKDSSITITDTVYKIDTVFYNSDEIKKIKLKK